jgi:hypothetical protein
MIMRARTEPARLHSTGRGTAHASLLHPAVPIVLQMYSEVPPEAVMQMCVQKPGSSPAAGRSPCWLGKAGQNLFSHHNHESPPEQCSGRSSFIRCWPRGAKLSHLQVHPCPGHRCAPALMLEGTVFAHNVHLQRGAQEASQQPASRVQRLIMKQREIGACPNGSLTEATVVNAAQGCFCGAKFGPLYRLTLSNLPITCVDLLRGTVPVVP